MSGGTPLALTELLAAYKFLVERHSRMTNESTGSVYTMTITTATIADGSDHGSRGSMFYFDPARLVVTGKTLKLRIAASIATNAVSPAGNFAYKLFPVTAVSGGASSVTITRGAQAGTTATIAAPGANTIAHAESADFDAPAAGMYVLTVENSNSLPASCSVASRSILEWRHV